MNVLHVIRAALAAILAFAAAAPSMAQAPACDNGGLLTSFDGPSVRNGFAAVQNQGGDLGIAPDPLDPSNRVGRFTAGPKRAGRVGKADLIHRFAPIDRGARLRMSARFLIPDGAPRNSVILMDLECAGCGLKGNPGIRLYLRDGRLRVDRSKIGIRGAPFLPVIGTRVTPGQWHDLTWEVGLGDQASGWSRVTLDGEPVIDARGATVILQDIVSLYENTPVREAVDRFQVGVTANSNPVPATVFMDDIAFCRLP